MTLADRRAERKSYYERNAEKIKAGARAWSAANQDRKKATRKAYYEANRDAIIAKSKKWERDNRERKRERNRVIRLREKYGITPDQFLTMLHAQSGICDICGRPFRSTLHIHIDHSHETGRVRSLLCSRCNTALGHLEKDQGLWLTQALAYLAKHSAAVSSGPLVTQQGAANGCFAMGFSVSGRGHWAWKSGKRTP